ncbi:ribonuclease E/G [Pseudosulfitobacter sp. DSM 107133]|uniref:Rne/Rng family ribonuclease n=1 Tax=Pseudosulfitobacter sp. DSM 107133 TaxID=2883100 RepID=UPI000DF3BC9D|nr:ribonuclease E/G [Pseudosulfitobacter sp. DSM 107133]
MPKKMLIDATHAEETRVVVVDGNKVEEFDFESENKRQLAGNIYLAKVTRVEPSLQAAFVDYGGNRHGFLAFTEIHPDYYQIPIADREALMEEERAYAEAQRAKDEDDDKPKRSSRSRSRSRSSTKAEDTNSDDAVTSSDDVGGMETIDLSDDADAVDEGSSPMETVRETPVETPAADEDQSHDDDDDNAGDEDTAADAADKDDSIESVADEDDSEDIRPARKPRAKRYKIQEVIKVRQILLVQVVKEERGNKGAALTTYLSLAGRYCVLMPNTARGGGISRKITNAVDRKKLKEIANEIEVPRGAGLIVRTAGAKRTKAEIKRDYEYLQRMWEQIRELTLKSIAPAKIYEEGDLIKRSIRDLYNRDIDEVFVEGERGYRIAKDFMKMIMPSHAKNVKRYEDSLPLFARYQVESYLAGMFNPTVQLPSGGYIVIGVTEALVAIDVNSGRATKEGSIEQTATKTNLEAAAEVARQLRLRDLAGLIVIDFIDMDERKNNAAVEKMMKDKLKTDRARIQVGRISGFGLMEMSRQRLRPGMIEATTQPCQACHGTGLIRSDDNLALSILRQIEEEGTRRRSREVLVKCPVGISNFLMNQKREHIAQIEARYGLSVRIEGDPALVSPDFNIEKFKTATRVVTAATQVVSVDTSIMDQIDEADARAAEAAEAADIAAEAAQEAKAAQPAPQSHPAAEVGEDGEPKPKRRRRRRRRRSKSSTGEDQNGENGRDDDDDQDETSDAASTPETKADAPEEGSATKAEESAEAKPKSTRSRSRSSAKKTETAADDSAAEVPAVDAPAEDAEAAAKPKVTRTRSTRTTAAKSATTAKAKTTAKATTAKTTKAKAAETEVTDAETPAPKPKRTRVSAKAKAEAAAAAEAAAQTEAPAGEATPEAPAVAEAPVAEAPAAVAPVAESKPAVTPATDAPAVDVPVAEAQVEQPEAKAEEPAAAPEPTPAPAAEEPAPANEDTPAKPKRKGWWSLGG